MRWLAPPSPSISSSPSSVSALPQVGSGTSLGSPAVRMAAPNFRAPANQCSGGESRSAPR
eukprot:10309706-Lingulodinium_polyedra.AAC.1